MIAETTMEPIIEPSEGSKATAYSMIHGSCAAAKVESLMVSLRANDRSKKTRTSSPMHANSLGHPKSFYCGIKERKAKEKSQALLKSGWMLFWAF